MKKILNSVLIILGILLSISVIAVSVKTLNNVVSNDNQEIKQDYVISIYNDSMSLKYGSELEKDFDFNELTEPGNYGYPWSYGIANGNIQNAPIGLESLFSVRVYYSIIAPEGSSYTKYITQDITDINGNRWIRTTIDGGSTWSCKKVY